MIDPIDRGSFEEPRVLCELLAGHDGGVVLFDIGGWFATVATSTNAVIRDQITGIIEDTENGQQKYDEVRDDLKVPVFSVARSALKDNEDFLVGQSVLFSADALIRQRGKLLQYMSCSILGYGKVGRSVAFHLLSRGIKPRVYDIQSVRRVGAYNAQCEIPDRDTTIRTADVLFCATGKKALDIHDFRVLKNGCFVFSVTSSDDEFDTTFLDTEYRQKEAGVHIVKYTSNHNYFYFVNKGDAVNFIHKAVLGDFIHLVRAEMIKAYESLLANQYPPDIYTVDSGTRADIAVQWLKHMLDLEHDGAVVDRSGPPHGEPTPRFLRR